jgi:hypothetical protein
MSAPLPRGDAPISDALAARSPGENVPLLLDVARKQAARRRPAELVEQYARDAYVAPSALDQRTVHALDALALDAAPDFEAVQLAPLAPLGVCSAISPTHQDRAVTTLRGTEVVSDPTNVLALECARRIASGGSQHVRLCTVHQVVRAQRFPAKPGFSQHFRLFVLAEAGFARADHAFEVDAVVSHASVFQRAFDLAARLGCEFPERSVTLLATAARAALAERVVARIADDHPNLAIERGTLESNYYDGIRLLVGARARDGQRVEFGDVGLFDWVARLTSNRRVRFVASGLGIQLFALRAGQAIPPHRAGD